MNGDDVDLSPEVLGQAAEEVAGHERRPKLQPRRVLPGNTDGPRRQIGTDHLHAPGLVGYSQGHRPPTGGQVHGDRRTACSARNSVESRGTNTPGLAISWIPRNSA